MSLRLLVCCLGVLVLGACGAAPGYPTPAAGGPLARTEVGEGSGLVLRGRVIDGTGAPPIEDGVVVITGERIACVGRAGQCRVPRDAQVLEAEGGTILPGLIDLHVHSRPHYLGWFLAAGVTTIRDANNSFSMIDTLLAVGPHRPRILWTGPMLDGPQTVMRFFGEEGVLRPTASDLSQAFTLEVSTADEARAAIDSLAARGASFVKLYEQLPPAVYRAAAERARERGLLVMTDLGMHGTRGLRGAEVDALQALAAGVRSIEHASGYALAYQRLGGDPDRPPFDPVLIDSLARATVRAGTAVVPTLSVFYAYADAVTEVADLPIGERFDQLPQEMREFFQQGAARRTPESRERSRLGFLLAADVARRVRELGGTVGAGSDSPAGVFNLPGGGIHRELELLVRAGLTPLEAIRAATGAAGEILGRTDLGVLRPGAAADVLLVAGNPAEDILATRRIRHVMQAGRPLPLELLLP
jgi:hypothetical protein